MFNEYEVFQWIKFRQEETERKLKYACRDYDEIREKGYFSKFNFSLKSRVNTPCCQCA